MDELKPKVIEICSDVEDFLDSYVLDDLNGEEELREYIDKLDVLKRDFRRVHTQLKKEEGENFPTAYPQLDP